MQQYLTNSSEKAHIASKRYLACTGTLLAPPILPQEVSSKKTTPAAATKIAPTSKKTMPAPTKTTLPPPTTTKTVLTVAMKKPASTAAVITSAPAMKKTGPAPTAKTTAPALATKTTDSTPVCFFLPSYFISLHLYIYRGSMEKLFSM
jgi:hypothetical protein